MTRTVRTEGGLLPADLLSRITEAGTTLPGLSPDAYHLPAGTGLNEAINRSWTTLARAWPAFRDHVARLPEADAATGATRERWLLPLFAELGYGRLLPAKAVELDGRSFPLSHGWHRVPIHLVGARVDLDRRAPGVAGAARTSPHGMVQEFLGRSQEHLWGFVSNGLRLRVLRDNASLTRQAYVEFDLQAMMEGEAYADFALLWLVCHPSRVEAEKPEDCWLERWSQHAREQGTRALDGLRDGVETAIRTLGSGFLAHPGNRALRARLRDGSLAAQDFYRELLRLVYRLLFLFVAEDRGLLLDPKADEAARARFTRFYSMARLRRLAERRRGGPHPDLYRGLRVLMERLGGEAGYPGLALPALGSFLWSAEAIADLAQADVANADLLTAVRVLAFTERDRVLHAVDYRNLGAEELGSVYESLLELHPEVEAEAARFELRTAGGHERKTTGSYYTPSSLIQCLLDSALDPVLAEAAAQPDAERAILALKVCDPACGSGHFLIAAAHRMARRLASARTGDEEPAPEAVKTALRDVIGRCLYGVDVNPMAVELCKVALWMDSLEPGRPLSFLDHRIVCGNSLLGATPALLAQGIPDEAFTPIEGDDRAVASVLKRQNKAERKGMLDLFADQAPAPAGGLGAAFAAVSAEGDGTITKVRRKEERWRRWTASKEREHAQLAADAWCAAFVWRKTPDAPPPLTQAMFLRLVAEPEKAPEAVRKEVARLAAQYRFFHWHVAFPDVFRLPGAGEAPENAQAGWSGGFDVVLGNPPWERIKLQEKEWFATRRPEIANAPNAAARRKMIAALAEDDPGLLKAFGEDCRRAEGESHLVRSSGRFPLCGRGDVNTYSIFAETMRLVLAPTGRVGTIVPSGIATDDTTKLFFQDLVERKALVSIYSFENEDFVFPAVHHALKFCLLSIAGDSCKSQAADLVFFARAVADLRDESRHFALTSEEFALVNPNTRTCPVFRSKRDAEITKAIYRRVPVLIREGPPEENPWGISFQAMFHMSGDSGLFRTAEQLEAEGWRREGNGNAYAKGGERWLPLYEAKMIHHFDHRYGDYAYKPEGSDNTSLPDVPLERLQDQDYVVQSRYWVPAADVEQRLAGKWDRGWMLGWRDITNATNERTVIAGVIPRVGVGNKIPLLLFGVATNRGGVTLAGNLSSLVFDFASRQKIGGTTLNFFLAMQLPALPPAAFKTSSPFDLGSTVESWIQPRVLELTYTAWDLAPFASDCGYDGPPFRWDEERRFRLRGELDAAFFHLYGINRADADYILDTFPIVRRNDEARWGEYRMKRVILECYDAMARAAATGEAYRTILDPQPADPSVAHPPRAAVPVAPSRATAAGTAPRAATAEPSAFPFRRVRPTREEKYRTCLPLWSLKAAAGGFSDEQEPEFEHWVAFESSHRFQHGMFVAQVVGKSMEPRIPDGAYCLFRRRPAGSREGKIVLVQHRDISDPETGGSYTVKRYHSEKQAQPDGTWRHTLVQLQPLNPAFSPIELTTAEHGELGVMAELVEVLAATSRREDES